MEIKKTISIFRLFLEHLIGFLVAVLALILIVMIAVFIAFQSGFLLQANATELALQRYEDLWVDATSPAAK